MLSDYFEKDISQGILNNDKEKIRSVNIIVNDNKNNRPANINK